MRVSQYSTGASNIRWLPETHEQIIADAKAIDVSLSAARHGLGRMAIEASTYERFVDWSNAAMRRMGIHLDPRERLEAIIRASTYACFDPQGGCFVCKAVDATGFDDRATRQVFELRNLGNEKHPYWVIKS